ncbi:unnamed protein product, partial [Mesorhabditis belari]|uniref:Uncharacterized protein n=1 Tax=Mesorhabditis belari TaxID=2138241 RepID=A0AAF3ELD5_9BILA
MTPQAMGTSRSNENRFSTFPSKLSQEAEHAKQQEMLLYQKLQLDRSAEHERDRREREAERRRLERWKDNRRAPRPQSLGVRLYVRMEKGGEDEVREEEMLRPKVNNSVQVSRVAQGKFRNVNPLRLNQLLLLNAGDKPESQQSSSQQRPANVQLTQAKDEISTSRRSDKKKRKSLSDADRNRRRKKSRSSGRKDSKRKKRRHRDSSSSSSSSDHSRKRSRHSKKKRHRRDSSSSPSSGASRKRRPKEKWCFLDVKNLDVTSRLGFDRATIFDREPSIELFQHDHVYKRERVQYNIKCLIVLGPRIAQTQRQFYEQWSREIYGEGTFSKAKPKRIFDRRIRWSANPENYFATKCGPIVDYMPLSSGRLDRPTTVDEETDMQMSKNEDISTDQMLIEIKGGGKVKTNKEKLKDINEALNKARANSTSKRVAIESLWIKKLELEDADHEHQAIKLQDAGEAPPTEQQYLAVKMSKIDAATKEVPSSLMLFKVAISVKKEVLTEEEMNTLFTSKIQAFASDPNFWDLWIDTLLYDMKFYNAKRIDEIFNEAIKRLDAILRGEYNVPRNLTDDKTKKGAILLLLQRRTEHLIQSGSAAKAVAFSQAILGHLWIPAQFVADLDSRDKKKLEQIAKSLEGYWDSGAAKIGDANAILWKNWNANETYAEPEIAEENQELHFLETQMVKGIAAKYEYQLARAKLWAELERLRENYYCRPIRISNDDFTAEDWSRLIRFEDLNLPNIDNDRVALFAIRLPNTFGRRRPFMWDSIPLIAKEFGGFNIDSRVPKNLDLFVDRLCKKLSIEVSNKTVARIHLSFRVLRIFDDVDDENMDATGKLRELLKQISMLTVELQKVGNERKIVIYPSILAMREAAKWFETARTSQMQLVFIKAIAVIWSQISEDISCKKNFLSIEDPMIFSLYATLLYLLIQIVDRPSFTIWLLTKVATDVFPATKDLLAKISEEPKLSGPEVLLGVQAWTQREGFYTSMTMETELTPLGLYQPATIFSVLFMHLQYVVGQGASKERFESRWKAMRSLVTTLNIDFDGAFAIREAAKLIEGHNKRYRNGSSKLYEILSFGTQRYPSDIQLRKMECESHITRPFLQRTIFGKRLRDEHQKAIASKNIVDSRILAVTRTYFSRRVFEHIMLRLETKETAQTTLRLLIKEYQDVATMQKEPFFWCQLISLFIERNEIENAYEAYMQGAKSCVWSRALHLHWAKYANPAQVEQIQKLMAQKDIKMLIEEELVDEYLKINAKGVLL